MLRSHLTYLMAAYVHASKRENLNRITYVGFEHKKKKKQEAIVPDIMYEAHDEESMARDTMNEASKK